MRSPGSLRTEIIKQLLLWTGIAVSIPVTAYLVVYCQHPQTFNEAFHRSIPGLFSMAPCVPPAGIIYYYWLHGGYIAKKKYGYYFLLLPMFIAIVMLINMSYGILINFALFRYRDIRVSGRLVQYSWMMFLAVDAPFVLFYTTMRGMVDLKKRRKQQEAERKKTAILLLKSQLEPHFLFNTLNAIYATAQKEKAVNTLSGIDELSEMSRQIMAEDSKDVAPGELKSIKAENLVEKKSKKYSQFFIIWLILWLFTILESAVALKSFSFHDFEPARVFILWPLFFTVIAFTIVGHYYLLFNRYIPTEKYVRYILFLGVFCGLMIGIDWVVTEFIEQLSIFGNDTPTAIRSLSTALWLVLNNKPDAIRNISTAIWRVLLVEMPIAFVYAMVREYLKARRLRNYQEQEDQKNEQLLMKNRLRPEFFNSALNTLQATATQENAAQTATLIGELKQLFSYSSCDAYQETVSAREELDFIERYIALQRIRISKQENIVIENRISWDQQPANIAPMLLLPFIENAFKYGISYEEPSCISIALTVTGKKLDCQVSNTDHSGKNKTRSSGIGIANTVKRLELQYAGKHQLEQKNENGIYAVSLKLDLS